MHLKTGLKTTMSIPMLGLMLILSVSLGWTQSLKPLAIEDAVQMHTFQSAPRAAFSGDGRRVAFTALASDRPKLEGTDTYARTGVPPRSEADIWISNVETRETRNLTGGVGANFKPSWSPNGHYLAFLSDRDGSGQAKLWVWDSSTNELKKACELPIRAAFGTEIEWLPDSSSVLITTIPDGLSFRDYLDRITVTPSWTIPPRIKPASGATVTLYEGGPAGEGVNILGTPNFNLDELYLHDLALVNVMNGEARFLIRGQRIERYILSPDGSRIGFVVPKRFYKPGSYRRYCDLLVLTLSTMKVETLASDALLNTLSSWSPDSKSLAYASYGQDDRSYELYVASATARSARRVALLPHETSDGLWLNPVWDENGQNLYVLLDGALIGVPTAENGIREFRIKDRSIKYVLGKNEGEVWSEKGTNSSIVITYDDQRKQDGFYQLDLKTGTSRMLREQGQCYTCSWGVPGSTLTIVSPDSQRIAYVAEAAELAPDLWICDVGFRNVRQLTRMNGQLDGYKLGSARVIDWLDDDGSRLQGALLLPSDYHEGERYPLIIWVYPGAHESNDLSSFSVGTYPGPLNMQLFATRGYAVLFPDERDLVGRRLEGLAKSVLPGLNRVIDMGIADPDRVGVMGHSQGGFAALGLLVETNRFKAALAADGWAESSAFYSVLNPDGSSFQNGQAERQLGGPPWQSPLTYIENSPLYFLNRLETPLLLVHGSNDDALPSSLSDGVFVGLSRLGRNVEYARYEGESHVPSDWSYANQLDLAGRALAWFDVYLKGIGGAGEDAQALSTGNGSAGRRYYGAPRQ
jgi:dipeptidyl aminopeptidase/acylaminoacyl peptidase